MRLVEEPPPRSVLPSRRRKMPPSFAILFQTPTRRDIFFRRVEEPHQIYLLVELHISRDLTVLQCDGILSIAFSVGRRVKS